MASEALSSAALWGQTAGVWGAAPVQVGSRDSAPGMAMSYGVEPPEIFAKIHVKDVILAIGTWIVLNIRN